MTSRTGKCLIATVLVALCVCGCVTGSPIEEEEKEAPSAFFLSTNDVPLAIRVPSTNPLVPAAHSSGVPDADVINDVTGSISPDINVTFNLNTSTSGTSANTAPTPGTAASGASGRDTAADDTRRDDASGSRAANTSTSRSIPTSTSIPRSDGVSRYTSTTTDLPDDVTTPVNDDPFFGDFRIGEGLPFSTNSSTNLSREPSNSSTDSSFITSSDRPFSVSDNNSPESREDGVFAPAAETSSKDTANGSSNIPISGSTFNSTNKTLAKVPDSLSGPREVNSTISDIHGIPTPSEPSQAVPVTSEVPSVETEGPSIQDIPLTVSSRTPQGVPTTQKIPKTVPETQESHQIVTVTQKTNVTVSVTQDTTAFYSPSSPIPSPRPSPENTPPHPSSSLSPPPTTSLPNTTTPPAPVIKRCCPKGFHMTREGCVSDSDAQPLHYNGTGQNDIFKCKNGNTWSTSKIGTGLRNNVLIVSSPFLLRRVGDFCLEEVVGDDGSDMSVYYLCYTDPGEEYKKHCSDPTSCVRKCCPEGYVLHNALCVKHEHRLSLGIVDYNLDAIESESGKKVISEFPACGQEYIVSSTNGSERQFYVMENGDLYIPEDHQNYLSYDKYCVDYGLDNHQKLSRLAFSCYALAGKPTQWLILSAYFRSAGLIISSVFLLITLVFYFCIAELKNLQGLSLLSHVAALFLSQVALLILTWMPEAPHRGFCVCTGFAIQLFFLWSFFWLNVICFDIWRYVGLTVNMVVMTGRSRGGTLGGKGAPYFWYMVYAWGTPLLIFLVSVTLFLLPARWHGFLRPSFIHGKCWFSRDMEILAFFYGPIAVLFVINLVLIMHTGLRLYRAGDMFTCCPNRCCPDRSSAAATSHAFNRPHLQEFWQRFGIFSIMAICWIFEILSWKIPPADAWAFTDTINSLQGFLVFVVFICNKQKRTLVGKLLKKWKRKVRVCWRNKASLGRQGTLYLSDVSRQGTSSSTDEVQLQTSSITRTSTGQTELSLNDDGLADGSNGQEGVYGHGVDSQA